MATMTDSRPTILIAGSLVVAAGVWALSSQMGTGKAPESSITEIDDEDEKGNFITDDEVARIFDRLFKEMQGTFAQLMQNIQGMQMQGAQIPEAQLRAFLKDQMERALTVRQEKALEDFDMDYDCLEEATWEFLAEKGKYPAIEAAVDRFQKFWENVSGERVAGWRPGKELKKEDFEILGPDRTIIVAEKYFNSLTDRMRELVAQYKAEGKDLKMPAVQSQLQMDFSSQAHTTGEVALKKEGVTVDQFEASVKAHSSNPNVGRALGMLQMKQQQELMSIGAS